MNNTKKEEQGRELEILRNVIIKKLKGLSHKKFSYEAVDDFSLAFRVFLLKYLQIEYEFTEDELAKELEKKRTSRLLKENIMRISNLLQSVKYGSRKITKEEFEIVLKAGMEIVSIATSNNHKHFEIEEEKKPAVLKSLFKNIINNIKNTHEKIKSKIRKKPKEEKPRNEIISKNPKMIIKIVVTSPNKGKLKK